MIPNTLEGWDYDIIKQLAENYMEGDNFDFKYEVKSRDPYERDNLVQTVCAFANTKGGFLIYGVLRDNSGKNELRGLERYDNYARDFGDRISQIDPTVYFAVSKFIPIPDNDKVLFVVHIPLSPQGPHMTDNGKFYYRTNKGNEIMTYNQVKGAFLGYEERRHKLRLLYIELIANNNIAQDILVRSDDHGKKIPLQEFEPDVIINLLPDIHPIIQDDRELLRLILKLRVEISQTNGRIRLAKSFALTRNTSAISSLTIEINDMIRYYVLPTIEEIKKMLESKYGVSNPFSG